MVISKFHVTITCNISVHNLIIHHDISRNGNIVTVLETFPANILYNIIRSFPNFPCMQHSSCRSVFHNRRANILLDMSSSFFLRHFFCFCKTCLDKICCLCRITLEMFYQAAFFATCCCCNYKAIVV